MAVMPMKRISITALKKDRRKILELLQRAGAVEIDRAETVDPVFQKQDMSSFSAALQRDAEAARTALEIINKASPPEGSPLNSLAGRKTLTVSEYEAMAEKKDALRDMVYDILRLDKEVQESRAELPKLENEKLMLSPWKTVDLPLIGGGSKTTGMLAGTLPGAWTLEGLLKQLQETAPELSLFDANVISSSEEQTAVLFFVHRSEAEKLMTALRSLGFALAPKSELTPSAELKRLDAEYKAAEQRISEDQEKLKAYGAERENLRFFQDYCSMGAEKYEAVSGLLQSKRTFMLEGWVPEENTAALAGKLSPLDLVLEFRDPTTDEVPPVKLKNNAFAAPVEGVVESYSLPAPGELDPSAVMAAFYYICFGLMLSDAAYGIIMVLATTYCLRKYPRMEEGMRKFMHMFLYCGISTTFWGFLFGSFFGDSVNVIATTFFGRPDITLPALWFEPVDKPMKMLVFSFVVGIIHLFTGLGIKLYVELKAGKIRDAIFDAGFWYMLVGGGIVYLLTMSMVTEMLGLGFTLPGSVGTVSAIVAAVGAAGIVLTDGRSSRNWFKRILKGLYGVYGVTSWLSDILSYSRLLALGLATSVISTVFNKMGSMLGASVPGAIVFILVFLIGHSMNIAINALGAYVHTNRLQYVEFFGKFYEGGGRKINPFGGKTKYYKVLEAK